MPKSPLPDVCSAPWVRPYRFSGLCPGPAWGLMAAAALIGGILVGAFGYWGGWLTYWLSQFALFATGGLWGTGLIGTGDTSSGLTDDHRKRDRAPQPSTRDSPDLHQSKPEPALPNAQREHRSQLAPCTRRDRRSQIWDAHTMCAG